MPVEPQGAQRADLAQPLLDPEPEEQAGQQQRRHNQEEAEVGEIFAEIGHPRRRLQREPARRVHDEAGRQRVEGGAQRGAIAIRDLVRHPGGRRHPHRGRLSPARAPQRLAVAKRQEPLGRRPVLVPVVLVLGAHQTEIDRKRGIPVREIGRGGDARIVWREVLVGRQPRQRDHGGHAELRGPGLQRTSLFPQVVLHRHDVTGPRLQIVGRPVVEDDRRRPPGGRVQRGGVEPERVEIEGGHKGVRRHPVSRPDLVGEIGQDRLIGHPGARRGGLRRLDHVIAEQSGRRLHDQRLWPRQQPYAESEILQPGVRPQGGLDGRHRRRGLDHPGRRATEQQSVCLPVDPEVALHPAEVDEDRPREPLLRPERELAESGGGQHLLDAQAHGAAEIVAAPVQRADRNGRRFLHTDEQRFINRRPQFAGQSAADQHGARGGGRAVPGDAVKLPEPVVDPVDLDAAGPAAALLMRSEPLQRDDRRHGAGRVAERAGRAKFVSQRLPEEKPGRDDVVHPAQPLQGEIAEAGPHRGADQERPGEYGYCHADTRDHGQIGPPEVGQAAGEQPAQGHSPSFRSRRFPTSSKRIGHLAANAVLWVTTTRIVS